MIQVGMAQTSLPRVGGKVSTALPLSTGGPFFTSAPHTMQADAGIRFQGQSNIRERFRAVQALEERADELFEEQQLSQAIGVLKEALKAHIDLVGEDHETVPEKRLLVSLWSQQNKQFDVAEAQLKAALVSLAKRAPDKVNDTDVPRYQRQLADVYVQTAQWDKAEEVLTAARDGYIDAVGRDHVFTGICISELADVLHAQNKDEEAEWAYLEAIATMRKHFSPDKTTLMATDREYAPDETVLLDTMDKLGIFYLNRGKIKACNGVYQNILATLSETYGAHSPQTLTTLKKLVHAHMEAQNWTEAETLLFDVINISTKQWGAGDLEVCEAKNDLAVLYAQQEKYDLSLNTLQEVKKALHKLPDVAPEILVDVTVNLARNHWLLGNKQQAESLMKEAQALVKKHNLPPLETTDED